MPDCSLVVTIFSRHSGPLQRTATRVTSMATFANEEHRYLSSCRVHASLVARRALLHAQVHAQLLFCRLPRGRRDRLDSRISCPSPFDRSTKSSRSRRIAVKAAVITGARMDACGETELAYKMIAERDNETVKIERTSSFVIVAKAESGRAKAGRSSSRMLTANPTRFLNSISCWRLDAA